MTVFRTIIVFSFLCTGCAGAPKATSSLSSTPVQPTCVSIFKPGTQDAMMRNLFEFYQQHEGRPYLMEIAANWLTVHEVGAYCEGQWQWGDLNADGIVNMEDFSIYAGKPP